VNSQTPRDIFDVSLEFGLYIYKAYVRTVLQKAKLGLLLGVYLPTIQHILGLLMFIRHAWMVGCAGVLEGFAMVFLCCLTVSYQCKDDYQFIEVIDQSEAMADLCRLGIVTD